MKNGDSTIKLLGLSFVTIKKWCSYSKLMVRTGVIIHNYSTTPSWHMSNFGMGGPTRGYVLNLEPIEPSVVASS